MSGARQRGQRFEKSDVKTRWARHWMPKTWPQASFTGRLTVVPGYQGVEENGSWQMTQRRWAGGMCLILMLGTERRKSKWAVVVLRSVMVVGESGIVMFFADSRR